MSKQIDSLPVIAEIVPNSDAANAGLVVGDQIMNINGVSPRDILEWHRLVDSAEIDLQVLRGHEILDISIIRDSATPLGVHIDSAVFDRIQTCDNHCEFCFIYQLPKGMRKSLYLKDDDYRLSFLFGNFTTLTRFTEADLERVLDEKLSPLYVSIHAIDPHVRSEMLRNKRGGFSLRWMKEMLASDIDINAQIVLCPGINDSSVLETSLAGLLDQCPGLASIALVPLGLSRFNSEFRMRVHTPQEARDVIDIVESWQMRYQKVLNRQPIHLSDEFYLVGQRDLPAHETYGNYEMLEDGVGLARAFIEAFSGSEKVSTSKTDGFFSSVDSRSVVTRPTDYVRAVNPAVETSLRAVTTTSVALRPSRRTVKPVGILTGTYGSQVLGPLLRDAGFQDVPVIEVTNDYFGGNTAVAGLLTFSDLQRTLRAVPQNLLYLLPDVCLNDGRFLDGHTIDDLAAEFDVEVVATEGGVLRRRLELARQENSYV